METNVCPKCRRVLTRTLELAVAPLPRRGGSGYAMPCCGAVVTTERAQGAIGVKLPDANVLARGR